ncbi:MAG: dNTP triphosphohydrolase, partial [Candidatus Izemoplasmatales bacterium]|nr:dNTP triphosphohydrolase [Candidatus Izemoplasmatales bacterium]
MQIHELKWSSLLSEFRMSNEDDFNDGISLKQVNDERSAFKRDFDTICNCSSLRRLQDKAQVFPLEKNDFSRTRLTHSLEVMSIAEALGEDVVRIVKRRTVDLEMTKNIDDIPVILKCAALIHDIGNPPFGHISEGLISEWFDKYKDKLHFVNDLLTIEDLNTVPKNKLISMVSEQMYNDFTKFDGNAQVLRIVTKLQNSVSSKGLNLTFPVLATIIKYPNEYIVKSKGIKNNQEMKQGKKGIHEIKTKKGYFTSELDIYEKIQKELGLMHKRHPLTFILEASDDIAYLLSDIEDAYKKGLVTIHDIVEEIDKKLRKPSNQGVDCLLDVKAKIEHFKNLAIQKNINDTNTYVLQRMKIHAKGLFLSEVKKAFEFYYYDIMSGQYDNELLESKNITLLTRLFRDLLENKVYYSKEIVATKLQACQVINSLIPIFMKASFNYNEKKQGHSDDFHSLAYKLISQNYRDYCIKSIEKIKIEYYERKNEIDDKYIRRIYPIKALINEQYQSHDIEKGNKLRANITESEKKRIISEYDMLLNSIKLEFQNELDEAYKEMDKEKQQNVEFKEQRIILCKVQLAIDHICGMTDSYAL